MKNRKPLMIGLGVLLVIALGTFFYWHAFLRGIASTNDARFAATMVDVSPQIGGRLSQLLVQEGAAVQAGDILYRLDDQDVQAKVASARTAIDVAKAGVGAANAGLEKALRGPRAEEIKSSQAAVDKIKAQVRLAKLERDRLQRLVSSNSATQQQLDQATTSYQMAEKGLEEAQERLQLLEAGTRPEDIAAARAQAQLGQAQLHAAQARLNEATIALSHTVVKAPFTGLVVKTWRHPGENVSPGMPVVTLVDPASTNIEANVEETELAKVAPGDPVDISVDAYPDLHLTGHVRAVLGVAQSQFSLMPSEGVSGSFIKVTQRVPLRVSLDDPPGDYLSRLGPGLSVELKIHTSALSNDLATARQ